MVEIVEVEDVEHDDAADNAFDGLESDGAHVEVHLAGDDAGDFLQKAFAVDGGKGDAGEQGDMFAGTPAGADDAVLVVSHLVHGHFAVGAVHHDFAVGDDAHDAVALQQGAGSVA